MRLFTLLLLLVSNAPHAARGGPESGPYFIFSSSAVTLPPVIMNTRLPFDQLSDALLEMYPSIERFILVTESGLTYDQVIKTQRKYPNVFKELETSFNMPNSIVLPRVEQPNDLVPRLSKLFNLEAISVKGNQMDRRLSSDYEKAFLWYDLKSATSSLSDKGRVQLAATTINTFLTALNFSQKPFLLIFTSAPSLVVPARIVKRSAEDETAATNASYLLITGENGKDPTCRVMLYATLFDFITYTKYPSNPKTYKVALDTNMTVAVNCTADTINTKTLSFDLTATPELKITVIMKKDKYGYWSGDLWKFTWDESPDKKPQTINMAKAYAPVKYSYHCTKADPAFSTRLAPDSPGNTKVNFIALDLHDFQVQAFWQPKGGYAFGTANDCVGFFNEVIWTGLFVSFLLIGILTFGMVMLATIQTPDRFDDAQTGSLKVNVRE